MKYEIDHYHGVNGSGQQNKSKQDTYRFKWIKQKKKSNKIYFLAMRFINVSIQTKPNQINLNKKKKDLIICKQKT